MSDPKDDIASLLGALKGADSTLAAAGELAYGYAAQPPATPLFQGGTPGVGTAASLGLGGLVGTLSGGGFASAPGAGPLVGKIPAWALVGGGLVAMSLMFGLLGRRTTGMRTQELVALLAGSILSGTEYQVQLRACKTPEETAKVVDEATAVAHAVILSAARTESLQALEKQKREIEDKIDSAKAKLAEVARGLAPETAPGKTSSTPAPTPPIPQPPSP